MPSPIKVEDLSIAELIVYAKRYAFLRERNLDAIAQGGIFAGQTPENLVLSGDELDVAIDAAIARETSQ